MSKNEKKMYFDPATSDQENIRQIKGYQKGRGLCKIF